MAIIESIGLLSEYEVSGVRLDTELNWADTGAGWDAAADILSVALSEQAMALIYFG